MTTPTNDFKPFAVGGSASVISQAVYAAATSLLLNGFQAGVADETYLNKVWRQSSIMAATIGALINDQTGQDAIDDGTTATLLLNLKSSIQTLANTAANSNMTIATTGGSTTLSATQYAAGFIYVTGALTSNATLVFPTSTGRWCVINNTTGGYTVTCKTAGGTGVTVKQGGTDTIVCNGIDVKYSLLDVVTQSIGDSSSAAASTLYVDRAVAQIGGYYQDTGSTTNAYVITTQPATTVYRNGQSLRFRTTRANTGGCTLDAGAGAVQMLREDRQPLQPKDIPGGAITIVTYDDTSGSAAWLVNEIVLSELGNVATLNYGYGMKLDANGNLAAAGTQYIYPGNAGSFTIYPGGEFLVDTTSAPVSVALPASPVLGDTMTFIDANATWGGNNFTLQRNGHTIRGQTSDLVCNVPDRKFTIWYNGSDWRLV